MDFLN